MSTNRITADRTWIPGLRVLRTYQLEWFRSDLVAGLSVAAVALPIGIAAKILALASRPHDVVLGLVREKDDVYSAVEEEGGRTIPGLIIYRFDSSLLFFNADYFKDRVRAIIRKQTPSPNVFSSM